MVLIGILAFATCAVASFVSWFFTDDHFSAVLFGLIATAILFELTFDIHILGLIITTIAGAVQIVV